MQVLLSSFIEMAEDHNNSMEALDLTKSVEAIDLSNKPEAVDLTVKTEKTDADDDVVNPWNVESKSDEGIDYDKLIGELFFHSYTFANLHSLILYFCCSKIW